MTNPYVSLMKTAWHYAKAEKKQYIFVYSLFLGTGIILSFYPLLYGWFINHIQQNGLNHLSYAWLYAGAYIGLKLLE